MKKTSKILLAVLVVLCVVFSAVALTACGEAGPQGLQGEAGPQGPQGATGATGATGLSAFEIWKQIEGNEDKTLDDYIAEIVNPVHNYGAITVIQPNDFYEEGYGYQVCQDEDCNEAKFVILPAVYPTYLDTADSEAKDLGFVGPKMNQATAKASFYINETDAAKYWNITVEGISGRVALIDENGDGTPLAEGELGWGETSYTFSLLKFNADTDYSLNIVVGGMGMTSAPANATISISEAQPLSSTTIAEGATQMTITTENTNEVVDGTAYYFTATTAGIYKITSNSWYAGLWTAEDFADMSFGTPFADFQMIESYEVYMAEGAVFNFIATASDPGTFIYIEKIA